MQNQGDNAYIVAQKKKCCLETHLKIDNIEIILPHKIFKR